MHSHVSLPARPDAKMSPEHLLASEALIPKQKLRGHRISSALNHLLKHSSAKRRRRHDHVLEDGLEYLLEDELQQ